MRHKQHAEPTLHFSVDREIEGFLAQQPASWHRDPEPTLVFGRPVFRCRAHARERAEAVSL